MSTNGDADGWRASAAPPLVIYAFLMDYYTPV
jgi:hypothetical protein